MSIQSANPFEGVKRVESSQELLDFAFQKAMNSRPPGGRGTPLERSRSHELNRINTAVNVLYDRIERIIEQFPSIDKIHPFYQEMCDLYFGVDQLKISLGRVHGIVDHLRSIQHDASADLNMTYHKSENKQIRKRAFGRLSSLVYRISPFLEQLKEAMVKLNNLPGFNPVYPTIVITGIPNAGKSSFIHKYTSGKPEIASYPFTTKEVIFGHRKLDFLSIQFVDTPGLLDRSFQERNDIELKAILALQYLSDIMIYFIDPTSDASCNLDEQLHLLQDIRQFYPTFLFLIAITKVDLVDQSRIQQITDVIAKADIEIEKLFKISSTTDEGIDQLFSYLEGIVKSSLLKSRKFRALTTPQIAEDQLTYDLDDEDEFYY